MKRLMVFDLEKYPVSTGVFLEVYNANFFSDKRGKNMYVLPIFSLLLTWVSFICLPMFLYSFVLMLTWYKNRINLSLHVVVHDKDNDIVKTLFSIMGSK